MVIWCLNPNVWCFCTNLTFKSWMLNPDHIHKWICIYYVYIYILLLLSCIFLNPNLQIKILVFVVKFQFLMVKSQFFDTWITSFPWLFTPIVGIDCQHLRICCLLHPLRHGSQWLLLRCRNVISMYCLNKYLYIYI